MNSDDHQPLSRRTFLARSGLATAGLVAGSGLLAACGSSSSPGGGTTGSSGAQTLTVSQPADATTMDPQLQGDVADMNILINMFDCLTTRDAHNRLVGQLATSWKAVDERTWRFSLRKGVTFHNGEPFDASVVKYSIERLLNPKTASPIVEYADEGVTGVKVVDSHTVDIISKTANPVLPEASALFDGVMVPPRYIEQVGAAKFAKSPVGTGPFTFVQWQPGNQVVLAANRKYWGGTPGIGRLVFKPVPDSATALASLESGELDIITGLDGSIAKQVPTGSSLRLLSTPGIRVFGVELDTLSPPLKDPRVRQALNYAVDVPALIKTLLNGYARQVATLIPEQAFGYDRSIAPYPYDPAKAKELLSAAGYPNGFSTQLASDSTSTNIAQAIAGQLANVGVKANTRVYAPQTFDEMSHTKHGDALGAMYLQGNSGWTLDAESYLQSYIIPGRRSSRYDNPTASRLERSEETSVSSKKRAATFAKLQQALKEDPPFIFLYQSDLVFPMSTRVKWQPNGLGMQAMNHASLT